MEIQEEIKNEFVVDGTICIAPKSVTSPSGIPHRFWFIQHQSDQYEMGLRRKVWIRLEVVVSGVELCKKTEDLILGDTLRCKGFLTSVKEPRCETKLRMYATDVQVINQPEEV